MFANQLWPINDLQLSCGLLIFNYVYLDFQMAEQNYTEEELTTICEDAFVNIKEACMRLQEKTGCSNEVVVKMLNNVSEYYLSQD